MVKKIIGRNQINVIDSVPYSELLFLVASGKNYALTIAEARGKKDSSPTAKQLKQLENRGFLKSHKEPVLNKTIYSINWEKIIDEFFKLLVEHKKDFMAMHEHLKTNINPEKLKQVNHLDDTNYIKDMKTNKYLKLALTHYFSEISKTKKTTLSSALYYFVFFGNFDFLYSTHPSIWGFLNWKETKKEIERIEKDKKEGKNYESSEDIKKEYEEIMANMKALQDKEDNHLNKIIKSNKDLINILFFNRILKTLNSDLGLQIALNEATELTAFSIIKENFSEEEIKEYQEQLFFRYSLRYKNTPQEVIEKTKTHIEQVTDKLKEFNEEVGKSKEKGTSHSNPSSKKEEIIK